MLNRLARTLRGGGICLTVKVGLTDPQACEVAALCGVDAVWLDREHCVGGWGGLYSQVLAANRRSADTIVRVPRGSYSDLVIPYEMGAGAIMVPRVTTAAEAEDLVQRTKFHPVGQRPLDGGNTDGDFAQLPFHDYMTRAHESTLLVLQLESPEAVANADTIAAVPGVDAIFFGPGDFAQAAGIPGDLGHRLVGEAQQRVAEAAQRAEITAGTVCHGATSVAELGHQGYRLINVGADVVALAEVFRRQVDTARATLTTDTPPIPNSTSN
ncbi:HpcH/HpaI aldolase family protein [Microlunatus sp. Y2014]|uniref:HpcH/HpaI aldolase family protein n=1 Tax=Microlunatus sp. Y2014 TaxID=3418488 RepID=UPI003DA790FB